MREEVQSEEKKGDAYKGMSNKLDQMEIKPETPKQEKEHKKPTKEDKKEVKREMKGRFQDVKIRDAITNHVFEKKYEERTLFQSKIKLLIYRKIWYKGRKGLLQKTSEGEDKKREEAVKIRTYLDIKQWIKRRWKKNRKSELMSIQ